MIVNGDLEGDDISYFRVNDYVENEKTELQEPTILSDDSGNHYLTVTGGQRLYITLSKPIEKRGYVVLSMKVKADHEYGCRVGLDSKPAVSQKELVKRIVVGTEWKNYTDTIYIREENVQTLSILPGANYSNNQYYFDDISIKVDSYSALGPEGFRLMETPWGEIKQGEHFSISYVLDADKSTSSYDFNGGIEGGKLEEVNRYIMGSPKKVLINAKFTMLKAGRLKVLPMIAVVDGKEIFTDSTYIDVIPDSAAEAKWKTVNDSWEKANVFFEKKGVKYHNLVCKYETETLCAFSDDWHHCFAIIANEPYAQYLDNPILAYGINEFAWDPINTATTGDDAIDRLLLEQFDKQLRYLFDKKIKYTSGISSIYKTKKEYVAPLLGKIAYGQGYPYNKYFPYDNISTGKREHCAVGCVSVAMAQILSYYRHPVQLKGTVEYTTIGGFKHTLDMSKYPVKWDDSEDDIAALMYNCAASISAEMTSESSGAYLINVVKALADNWGYSNTCTYFINKDANTKNKTRYRVFSYGQLGRVRNQDVIVDAYVQDDKTIWYSIYRELDYGRPVMIGGGNHAYVCDGYDSDYLHYNIGWDGFYNGYYRTLILPEIDVSGSSHIEHCIIGIAPKG